MGGRSVRVLHISDLHMRTGDGPQAKRARLEAASRWRVLGEKWTANLEELREGGVPFDLVVFTGDLGDWGHPTDYPRAFAFLKDTCAALAVPLDRLFVIPGNHDVDRQAQAAAWRWVRKNIGADPRAYSEWMTGGGSRELRRNDRRDKILERQQAFWAAVETELGRPTLSPSRSPHQRLGYRQAVALPGLSQPIQVIGLDTAWLAGDDHDSGALRLTEHQVSLLTTTADGAPLPGFRLALMHHRFADLADAAEARQHMAERVDLLLHGHQHEPTADLLQGPDHQLLVLATGCLYEGDAGHRYPNACQVIDLALDEHARPQGAKVRFRGWSDRGLFWGDDALLYRSARKGRLRLGCGPRGWRFEEDGEEPRAPDAGRPPASMPGSAPARSQTPRAEAIDFTIERQRHARFVGRDAELAQLDEWLLRPGQIGWVVVTGGPGMGKSALLSQWLARREAAGIVVPHHFVRRQVANWDQPEALAASLAAQIEAMFPAPLDPEAKPEARLLELLGRVSKQLGPAGRLVVLVDGLDETRAEPGENPLPRFLPHAVPAGIRILCAMRKEYPHLGWIETRSPARRLDLDDPRWAASNEAVVRGFWQAAATEYEPPLPAETVARAIERAEGNVLHAVMLHDALQSLLPAERRAGRVPHGLRGLIGDIWKRAASDEKVRAGLGLLCAAQEALSLDVLGELAGWSYDERERFLPSTRQLLLEEPASWSGAAAYRPRHEWVRELMAERLGAAAVRAHHGTLAQKLAIWPAPPDPTTRRYALRHALVHRVEVGAWQDAWRRATDMHFLEAKCRELGAHEAEADVAWAAERCRASGDESLRGHFDDLARALGRESHWLRTAPEATAALVWNRLRQLGWSPDKIDEHLQLPADASFLRARHIATRESPTLIRNLAGHAAAVLACAMTPDGQRVVSASDDRTLKVWDLATSQEAWTLAGHAAWVRACAVTPDGRHVVSASDDKTLKVWDLATGQETWTLAGHAAWVRACAVTPDGRRVVSASDDNTLKVWDLATGQETWTLAGHADVVRACVATPDGRHVVSASDDHTLKVWDLATGQETWTLAGHANAVRACAVTPDGRRVVSASEDHTLKVWDLATGQETWTLTGHAAAVRTCAVTPDGRRVVSTSFDHTLKVWDLTTGQERWTLAGHAAVVRACAVTPDGRRVVSTSDDATLKVWDLATGQETWSLAGHAAWVRACAVTPDGRRVVSASLDTTLKVWDLATGQETWTLNGHADEVRACAVTPDGRRVVSASDDNTLKVWDLATGQETWTLAGHAAWVRACAVTPDGRRVVSASEDHTLKVWDLATGQETWTLAGHAASVGACAVTPDGRRVVSASDDHTLKVWDLATGQAQWTLVGHAGSVSACAVTPDGRRVVSASRDHTLKVWDLATGQETWTLAGHADEVRVCAVTPDGRRVVSASWDHTLKVWDLATGTCLFTHHASANYTAIAVTATAIIAGDGMGSVWFLDVPAPNPHEHSHRDDRGPDNQRPSAPDSQPSSPRSSPIKKRTSPPSVPTPPCADIGILTIRPDEFRAVLDVFPRKAGIFKGKNREYTLRYADAGNGQRYTVAILRQIEQGNGEAQDAARDLLEDLAPKLMLVVGIAGAIPSEDVKLGDVVISTRIHDFTVEARKTGRAPTYAAKGGAISKALAAAIANLDARKDELGDWTARLPRQPTVTWTRKGQLYGPQKWQRELQEKLEHHYRKRSKPRAPELVAGTIASSDRLVKDPKLLFPWLATARDILAVEMESGGVFRAARERCPMLAIRGISDIVGLKRSDTWTKYACASAAAFTRAYLRTQPVASDPP
ncbi:MAG TPA: PQQ-binding-like beta-propeller repeat protein [Kofleriaceae bacterium]|nr:PQQ-binding-like beta-propeller repeat protein [Kofleriaceae bacterium]